MGLPVGAAFLLMARTGRHVGFLTDDRVDPGSFCLQVKIDRAVEHPVIGEGDRRHPGFGGVADHLRDPARAVEQAEFGMRVEVDETHAVRCSLATASMWYVWGNMSTKATSARVYRPPAEKRLTSRASVEGSQEI